ncbi:hypothetical protein GYA49_01345 [Candidatus Beckwithbacteria bacterium]|nr:hypothetical protein [Candidatus Beckwithbacteria bacterium]
MKNNIPLVVLSTVVATLLLVFIVLSLTKEKNLVSNLIQTKPPVTISGEIDFNGITPDHGTLVLKAKPADKEGSMQTIVTDISPSDKAHWSWSQAESGINYQLQAELELNGQSIAKSNIKTVTAPANHETLTINLTKDELVKYSKDGFQDLLVSNVSGAIDLNGYIPANSKIVILAKANTDTDYTTVADNVTATDGQTWQWTNATYGTGYDIKAILESDGNDIGESPVISVTAPASNEFLRIVSAAKQPAPQPQTTKISGTIDLNGPVADNSTILVLQKKPSEQTYQVINRYSANDGQYWEWDNAISGVEYEITAALQVNDNNTATANAITVTAPANNETLTINTGVNLPTPSSQPKVLNCGNENGNQWPVSINYPGISNATMYWIQIGTQPGFNDVYNQMVSSQNGSDKSVTVNVNDQSYYYTRYAYADCDNCTQSQDYSNFSNTLQFHCGNNPSPDNNQYTGYICDSSSHSCQLSTDDNATYSFTNAGLAQCQRSCGPFPLVR